VIGAAIEVTVAYAGPEGEAVVTVALATGATVADAVARSQLVQRFGLAQAAISYAIFGQRARASTPLRSGDRVELLRPLIADPKDARRRHAALHPLPRPPPRRKRPA
jgi:putative ubiquitin-RnfH superfamily antitoxin RatB of RatAB toxin-antitoxin module